MLTSACMQDGSSAVYTPHMNRWAQQLLRSLHAPPLTPPYMHPGQLCKLSCTYASHSKQNRCLHCGHFRTRGAAAPSTCPAPLYAFDCPPLRFVKHPKQCNPDPGTSGGTSMLPCNPMPPAMSPNPGNPSPSPAAAAVAAWARVCSSSTSSGLSSCTDHMVQMHLCWFTNKQEAGQCSSSTSSSLSSCIDHRKETQSLHLC
jgi:hypothetical protein